MNFKPLLAATVAAMALSSTAGAANPTPAKNVVLVHGGFVDGSGWQKVYNILKKDGYNVTIVQNPTTSLADDVAFTKRAIAQQDGPVVLVGHSYGGVVISEAGTDPKVERLVYIAAFAPDEGESVQTLIANPPPGAPVPPILPPQDGFLFLDRAKFAASFAGDVPTDEADFMADSQVPWGVEALARRGDRAGVEVEAELVPRRHRRPHDPAAGAADDGQARGREGDRSAGQPCDLCVAARSGRQDHRAGGERRSLIQGVIEAERRCALRFFCVRNPRDARTYALVA